MALLFLIVLSFFLFVRLRTIISSLLMLCKSALYVCIQACCTQRHCVEWTARSSALSIPSVDSATSRRATAAYMTPSHERCALWQCPGTQSPQPLVFARVSVRVWSSLHSAVYSVDDTICRQQVNMRAKIVYTQKGGSRKAVYGY